MNIELRAQLDWQCGSGALANVRLTNVTARISLPNAGHASVAYLEISKNSWTPRLLSDNALREGSA